jgi:protein gp37
MGAGTLIPWCHDTLNWWIGCTKFAEECAYCYAAEQDRRRFSLTLKDPIGRTEGSHWGPGRPRHLVKSRLQVLGWNRFPFVCDACGKQPIKGTGAIGDTCRREDCGKGVLERRRVFTGSLMDWADEEVSDAWRDELFRTAEDCRDLIFLFLTKRGRNAMHYIWKRYGVEGPPDHFWGGMSYMHKRPEDVAYLINTPWRVRFLSVEPMLAPANLCYKADGKVYNYLGGPNGIDWVIFGGESGPGARPCNITHIQDGIRQCRAGGAAPFVKQMGANMVCDNANLYDWPEGTELIETDLVHGFASCRVKFRDPKGGDMAEWPEDLRVRDFPPI